MSQPRRRRRRRRRTTGDGTGNGNDAARVTPSQDSSTPRGPQGGRSRRRSRGRGTGPRPAAPQTLEEVVEAINGGRPAQLTAPNDGQTLERVIGELQSVWGVPQYPQEYRITLKVVEERITAAQEREPREREPREPRTNGMLRERAPAAPRVGPAQSSDSAPKRERAPRRRRRPRRGRRRRGEE